MDAAELLAELKRQGFVVAAAEGGLRVAPASRLSPELREQLRAYKAELLVLLTGEQAAVPAEMERILQGLRQQLALLERDRYGSRFPEAIARLVGDGVALCEGHIRGREQLAAQGWEPLEYLRGQVQLTLALARGERPRSPEGA
jgi:hypothetical protein